MKIIDLLNKIANGEEVPKKIRYEGVVFIYAGNGCYCNNKNEILSDYIYAEPSRLNEEIEILKEEKEIPEKLPYYSMEKIQKAKNKDEWREERITLLEKRVEDLHIKMNDLLDYLKSKGE